MTFKGLKRFAKAEDGTTAVEFALIAAPFFYLLLAILEVSIVFATTLVLENGVNDTARKIRTGEFQLSGGGAAEFRDLVCESVKIMIECDGDLYIDVQNFANFGSSSGTDPLSNGNLAKPPKFNPGGAGSVVVVRVYYAHQIHTPVLGQFLANRADNKRLISWTAAFENEPY